MSSTTWKISVATVALTTSSVLALHPPSASASENRNSDTFSEQTTDANGCGGVKFVDYGPGRPGGGNNDDYIWIYDNCPDGWGVRVKAWVVDDGDKRYRGKAYNAHGFNTRQYWDPFKGANNVKDQIVDLQVCLVEDGDTANCASGWNGPID